MNKRGIKCRDEHGCWDFGGGGIDLGETVEKQFDENSKKNIV